jgi:hypothetical protein
MWLRIVVAGYFENGNETSGSIKGSRFLESLATVSFSKTMFPGVS